MLVPEALCLAQANTVYDGGVVELIAYDRITFSQKRLEHSAVRIEAGGEQYGVVSSKERTYLTLKILVQLLGATDETYGRKAVAPHVHCSLGSLNDLLVVRKSKIVVGAEVQHIHDASIWILDLYESALGGNNHPLLL